MKIAFVGTGNVGGTLAKRLGKAGHAILLGVRDVTSSEVKGLALEIGPKAALLSLGEAANQAEVIILAIPWNATEEIVKGIASQSSGKILIDCTNPLKKDLSGLEVGLTVSGGELVQTWAPRAQVFKAFNTTGFNIMADPVLESRKPVMFFCGDDKEKRSSVKKIVEDVGFEAVDAGPLSTARLLEPYALLWIQSAYKFDMGRDFAFGLLRRK